MTPVMEVLPEPAMVRPNVAPLNVLLSVSKLDELFVHVLAAPRKRRDRNWN